MQGIRSYGGDIMGSKLKATIVKERPENIQLEIDKKNFESFCDAAGLFRKDFIKTLGLSEKDHKVGRVKERKSLAELIDD